ncbi:hypothetical protein L3X38_030665 [Prunus dulcis]|uniref:Uncharacterized protein n=1 Tax=Prunus dulcis TaxID=3755 RepID=A0AAD4YU85_PRUDU|nr:hypothetical protein L3X38_030665 [Prunus dulcis]
MCCLATHDLAATLKPGMNLSSLCPNAITRKMIVCGLAHRDRAPLHMIQHWNNELSLAKPLLALAKPHLPAHVYPAD